MDLTPMPQEEVKPRTMDFPDAIRQIIQGKKVARVSWGNTDFGVLEKEYLSIFTKGSLHTWLVSQGDLEGQDWVVVE